MKNFDDDEGGVDEPLAPLPDEPEVIEDDDEAQDEELEADQPITAPWAASNNPDPVPRHWTCRESNGMKEPSGPRQTWASCSLEMACMDWGNGTYRACNPRASISESNPLAPAEGVGRRDGDMD